MSSDRFFEHRSLPLKYCSTHANAVFDFSYTWSAIPQLYGKPSPQIKAHSSAGLIWVNSNNIRGAAARVSAPTATAQILLVTSYQVFVVSKLSVSLHEKNWDI